MGAILYRLNIVYYLYMAKFIIHIIDTLKGTFKNGQTPNLAAVKNKQSGRISFAPLFTIGIALMLTLVYAAFSSFSPLRINNAGMQASVILAQNNPSNGQPAGAGSGGAVLQDPLGNRGSLANLINKIIEVLIQVGAIFIVIMIILSGFKYVMAQGNSSKISEANNQLKWTIIGAAILLGAKVISMIIQNTVKDLSV